MNKLNIVYFGTPEFSAYILEQLIKSHPGDGIDIKFNIKAVVTSPDKPVGRKQVITPSAVSTLATKHKIPVLKPVKLDSEFITTHYSLITSHLFIVASFGKIIPQSWLDIPKYGTLNVHGSLLPKYRGASPIQAAILNGDKKTGVTVMLMDAKMDHGPILATEKINIQPEDTFESLSNKMSRIGSDLLIQTIPKFINGSIKPRGQRHAVATFCPLVKKEDGYFDLPADKQSLSPEFLKKLERMIRAYYPWPNAWTTWQGKIVKFLPCTPVTPDGSSIKVENDKTTLIQMEGKKPTRFKDFLNGYPGFPKIL